MAAPRVFDESDFDDAAPAAATGPRVFDEADFDDGAKPGDPVPFGQLASAAAGAVYRGSLPGRVHQAIGDYFTDERRPDDKPVSTPRAMGLAAQQVLGGDDGEIARDDAPQPGSFGGEGARYLPSVAPPADGRARAEIDAGRADEIRRASDQHPYIYRGTQGALAAADLGAGALEGVVRGGANALNRFARREGGRVAGYTPALVESQGPRAVERAIDRGFDEGIITRSNRPQEMLASTEAARGPLGEVLARVRADLDSIKEGISLQDLVRRLDTIRTGRQGTRANVRLDEELTALIDDAGKYADDQGFINASSLGELKNDWGKIYRDLGEPGVQSAEGVRGLTRDAHGEALGAENEVFGRAAPGAIADKQRYGDLSNLGEALGKADAKDVLAPRTIAGRTMTDRVIGVMDRVYGGPQGRAVDARALARIAESRFAPVLEAVANTGGVPRLTATLQALRSNPEFQALVYGEDEPAPGVPPTPSDERVKSDVKPMDSKQVLRRYVQVQAAKRPATTKPTPTSSSVVDAAPPEKRREAYAMKHEGGRLRSIEGARRRITIVRDDQGLPVSMDVEDL